MNSYYYIFAPQRSGTNYTETLIAQNFSNVLKLNNGQTTWKHSIEMPHPAVYNPEILTIIMSKNPYQWVESLAFRNSVDWAHRQTTYPIDEPTEPEFHVGIRRFNLINLVMTYKHFYGTWLVKHILPNKVFFRYEELLNDDRRESILSEIKKAGKFERRGEQWVNPRLGSVSQSHDYNAQREQYYKSMKPAFLKPVQIDKINEVLGQETFDLLGYNMIQP